MMMQYEEGKCFLAFSKSWKDEEQERFPLFPYFGNDLTAKAGWLQFPGSIFRLNEKGFQSKRLPLKNMN